MFCKWCGKKIKDNAVPCPHCGRKQPPLESGNGFWDLCDNNPIKDGRKPVESGKTYDNSPNIKQVSSHDIKRKQKKSKTFPLLLAALLLSAVSLIAVMICNGNIKKCRKDIGNLSSAISTESPTQSSEIDELKEYLERKFADLHSDSKQSEKMTKDEEKETEDEKWWDSKELKTSDQFRINRYQVGEEKTAWLYIIDGDEDLSHMKFCWQTSEDSGETWDVVAEDTNYIVTKNLDTMVRVAIKKVQENVVELDGKSINNKELPIKVNMSTIADNLILYQLEDTDNVTHQWQYSQKDGEWETLSRDLDCLVNTDEDIKYRLVLNEADYYQVKYIPNEEPDDPR